MTQIVGILCRESILLASERQGTFAGTRRNFDLQKIRLLRFDCPKGIDIEPTGPVRSGALVAFAGASAPALRAIHFMQQSIDEGTKLDSKFALADIAVEAIAEYRREVLQFYSLPEMPKVDQDALFSQEENSFTLLLAHFYNYDPFLYSVNSDSANINQHSRSIAIGSGSDLATFLLGQIDAKDLDWQAGIALAVDTIEHIKGSDIYCGGPIDVGLLQIGKRWPNLFPVQFTDRAAKKLKAKTDEIMVSRKEGFKSVMEDIYREIDDAITAEQRHQKEVEEHFAKFREEMFKETLKHAPLTEPAQKPPEKK